MAARRGGGGRRPKAGREVRGSLDWTEGSERFTGGYVARGNQITVTLDGGGERTELYNSPSPEATARDILRDLIRARLRARE